MRNLTPIRSAAPLVAAALLLTVLAALSAPPARAAESLRVSVSPATAMAGGSLKIDYAIGSVPATLSVRLDRNAPKKVRVQRRHGRTTFALPASAAPGPHRLTVCLQGTCRSLPVKVLRRSPAAAPQGPAAPSSAPAAPSPPPPPDPPPGAIDFTGPANPLDVLAHTDASRRAAATIGSAGGTLETTGADGTRYRLIVPEGALLSPERVSMTPIGSVEGLPFSGGLAAGVQLEPSGLRFTDFVTVEISNHPPVGPEQETGFLYQRDGVEFQLYPLEESPSKTTFRIIHFSGVGIASGTEAERNAQLLRATRDGEGRFGQQLATYFRPGEGVDYPGVEATLRAYHDQILKPLMTAAATDDGLSVEAINRYLPWARMVELLFGGDDPFMAAERQALSEQWVAIIRNAALAAHRRCIEENRPEELPMVLSWWRMLGLMGLGGELPADAISGCARFELDFHTKLTQKHEGNVEGPEVWTGEAIAENVFIEPDPVTLEQRGSKDAQYVDFRVEIPAHAPGTGCWRGGGEWESTFPLRVSRLMIDLNPVQRPDGSYGYPELERGKIAVSIVPFFVKEFQFYVDCGGSTGEGGWGAWLAPTFFLLHQGQLDQYGGMVFADWTVPSGGGSMLGAKAYLRTVMVNGAETREETTLELYHAPTG